MHQSDLSQHEPELQASPAEADADPRPRLLMTLADLFTSQTHHSPDEIRQFEAAVQGLLPHAYDDVRLKAADRLADYPHTPQGVLRAFLALGGDAAAPFLKRSVCMQRSLVAEIVREGDAEAAVCIAHRVDLDPTLVGMLCARPEIEVLRALARNPMAPLDRVDFEGLVRQARFDRPLARSLCMRARDPMLIAPLFLLATPLQRDAIILAARRAHLGAPLSTPLTDAELTIADDLIDAAEARNLDDAAWLVARAVGCTTAISRDIIADASGEPLALVLALLRIEPVTANRILNMFDAPPLRSPDRIKALTNIIFDTPRGCADRLLKEMVGLSVQRGRPALTPVNDPSAAQTPSRPAQMGEVAASTQSTAPERKLLLVRR
jgi:uncharacterized protein (DUF2336 family)